MPIASSGWMIGFAADTKHESSYNPLPEQDPLVVQNGYWLLNGSVRVFSEDGKWEFAVFGRNLTNGYRAVESASGSFTGRGALTGPSTLGGRKRGGGGKEG